MLGASHGWPGYADFNNIGSRFSESSGSPRSPASRSEDGIDLNSRTDNPQPAHLLFDIFRCHVDFTPSSGEHGRVGSQNEHLKTTSALPSHSRELVKPFESSNPNIRVGPPSSPSNSIVLTPQSSTTPYTRSLGTPSVNGDPRPAGVGLSRDWSLPQKVKTFFILQASSVSWPY